MLNDWCLKDSVGENNKSDKGSGITMTTESITVTDRETRIKFEDI